jgi:hypothetical protein
MIKKYTLILILLYCALFGNNPVLAQDKIADSIQLRQTTANMAALFDKAVVEQSRLYNGPAFVPYKLKSETNANFQDLTDFNIGSVNYDGIVYTNVPLIYNIDRDMLVSKLYNGFSVYTLLSDMVYEFDLLNHHFVRILPDNLNKQMVAGFYDELYNGKLQLLARRVKTVQTATSLSGMKNVFYPKTDYFLKKGGVYYNANSRVKILDVLKDKKKELKQYIKDNKVDFGDNPEPAMVMLVAYYDHLTK